MKLASPDWHYQPPSRPADIDPFATRAGVYFLYGSLMDPIMLMDILGLDAEPVLGPADVEGYCSKLWGQYPALVDGPKGQLVNGMAYYVRTAEDAEKLAIYESKNYRPTACRIRYTDGHQPMEGLGCTFKFIGRENELTEGSFDLPYWLQGVGHARALTRVEVKRAKQLSQPTQPPLVHIIRHGQSLHNVDRSYNQRDPPLTEAGHETSKNIELLGIIPDLILVSPMIRTLQTAINAFPDLQNKIRVWPDLREAHNAECNKGSSKKYVVAQFPQFDYSQCSDEWDYPLNTTENAIARAETVRKRLRELSITHRNIVVITHRGFIAYLVQGERFDVCQSRTYRFIDQHNDKDLEEEALALGVHVDTEQVSSFGPTILIPYKP